MARRKRLTQTQKVELVRKVKSRYTKDYRLLRNLFRSGNKFTSRQESDDTEEIEVTKEEIDMALVNDVSGGFGSARRAPRNKGPQWKFVYNFDTRVDDKTGEVRIKLTEIDRRDDPRFKKGFVPDGTHTWIFPRQVIVNYLEDHPLNIYDQPRREGLIRQTIDDILLPLQQNDDTVVFTNDSSEVVTDIYLDQITKLYVFEKSDDDTSINPVHRHEMDRVAWCWCLLAVFKNVRYDEYYGSVYDITTKFRSVERFQDLVNGEAAV